MYVHTKITVKVADRPNGERRSIVKVYRGNPWDGMTHVYNVAAMGAGVCAVYRHIVNDGGYTRRFYDDRVEYTKLGGEYDDSELPQQLELGI